MQLSLFRISFAVFMLGAIWARASEPIVESSVVFEEQDGLVAVEAEHFFKQDLTETRQWMLHSSESTSEVAPDGDASHVAGASGGAYLEVLPDTRRTHADKLIHGENFSNEPGKLAVLSYKVHFNTAGRYYVWVRAYSTGSEDNGLHVGLDGAWPESGQRMQWCQGKQAWRWESKQRTEQEHCGVPHQIYLDVAEPGEHVVSFSQREDGFEFDRFLLTTNRDFSRPTDAGPDVRVKKGKLPEPFAFIAVEEPTATPGLELAITATQMIEGSEGYYLDKGKWLAIHPEQNKSAKAQTASPMPSGKYNVTLETVGEEDGQATYQVFVNDEKVGEFTCPLSEKQFEEGPKFNKTWKSLQINAGDMIRVESQIASEDGQEFSRARVSKLAFEAADDATRIAVASLQAPTTAAAPKQEVASRPALVEPREADGSGAIAVSGELKQWHKVTLTLDGPFAHEQDNEPNPFTDYAFSATITHESGRPSFQIPGYFAADGDASESAAESGTKWRVHLSPDLAGKWNYTTKLVAGKDVAIGGAGEELSQYAQSGSFEVAATNKAAPDFRAAGRLEYVGQRYLRFAGNQKYFLKAGPDAPETLLGYEDFDNTIAGKPGKVPLKSWQPHVQDWQAGDPTWRGGKGKGLIGALNYLSTKGCNSFSFLPYNAGGDGDNVWPFVERNDKFHYDCSKLDQWGIVFDHATARGLYLHFKLQENEIDDNRKGQESKSGVVPEALDGGLLGRERKLYCRELIARFAHALALNWNIGEENTQSYEEQRDMIRYLQETDPYDHNIVIHTFPNQQDKVYTKLLGNKSVLTGASLQNSWSNAHERTLKWIQESANAGRPWVVCNDEQNPASDGVPADPGYEGKDGFATENGKKYNLDDIRKRCLWGTLMAGGAGVEYYFGYKLPQNDLICEDFRSRDKSWDYCRIALAFFQDNDIPFWEMKCIDFLQQGDRNYCFAKPGQIYLVYLPEGGDCELTLSDSERFSLEWFNPREGGALSEGALEASLGKVQFSAPGSDDWLAVIRKK